MTSEELDRKLRDLRQATERIGANLLQLELDPNRELLEKSPLEGHSAEGWAATSAALTQLWQWHGDLEALLARAEKLRETRARLRPDELIELDALLSGPSIEFAGQPVPLEERDLFGQSPATQPCTPESLLARMSTSFEEAKAFLVAVGRAWDTYLPRLGAAQAGLAQTVERADGLGATDAQRLERVGSELTGLVARLARDPLSVTLEAVEAAEVALDAVRHDVDSLGELSREIGNRLAGRARASRSTPTGSGRQRERPPRGDGEDRPRCRPEAADAGPRPRARARGRCRYGTSGRVAGGP